MLDDEVLEFEIEKLQQISLFEPETETVFNLMKYSFLDDESAVGKYVEEAEYDSSGAYESNNEPVLVDEFAHDGNKYVSLMQEYIQDLLDPGEVEPLD